MSQRWSIQQEVGYGRYNLFPHASSGLADPLQPGSVQVVGQQVWRYRVEARRYRPARADRITGRPRAGRPYVAYEFLTKRVLLPQTSAVGRDCDGGACAYTEQISYTNVSHVYALHFKFGKQYMLEPLRAGLLRRYWLAAGCDLEPERARRCPVECAKRGGLGPPDLNHQHSTTGRLLAAQRQPGVEIGHFVRQSAEAITEQRAVIV